MALPYNDGGVPYGSRVLSINSVNYVAEDIVRTAPFKAIDRTNQLGEPSGHVAVPDFVTGTATLQLAANSTAKVEGGMTFITNFIGSNETFVITEVGQPESREDAKKQSVSFKKVYN